MLCWMTILGGVLIMMGQHSRSEALFYYFRLEDQVPESHLLRLIEKHISLAFVREKLKDSYSETGRTNARPAIVWSASRCGQPANTKSECTRRLQPAASATSIQLATSMHS